MGSSAATDAARSGRRSAPRSPRSARTPARLELSEIEGGASRQTFLVATRRRAALGAPSRARGRDVVQLARGRAGGDRRRRPRRRRGGPDGSPSSPRAGASAPARATLMEFVAGTSVAPRVLRARRARRRARAAPGAARRGARPDPHRRARRGRGARRRRGRPRARGVRALGGGSSTRSASRCRRSRPACAGCASTRRRPPRPRLVHGDFRLGNLIVDEHGLAAVIDWELCHAGDPAEDLAWLCIRSWRFGNDDLPVAGRR